MSDSGLDTRGFLAGRVTVRRLPVVDGAPRTPITTGGRIRMPAGEFAQVVNGEDVRFVAYLEFKAEPGLSRGNHYHLRKSESLYVIAGRLRARFADPATREQAEVELETGDLARVATGIAHGYEALEHTQAIETSSTAFDPADVTRYAFE